MVRECSGTADRPSIKSHTLVDGCRGCRARLAEVYVYTRTRPTVATSEQSIRRGLIMDIIT